MKVQDKERYRMKKILMMSMYILFLCCSEAKNKINSEKNVKENKKVVANETTKTVTKTKVEETDLIKKNILEMKNIIKNKEYEKLVKYVSYEAKDARIWIFGNEDESDRIKYLSDIIKNIKGKEKIEKKIEENINKIFSDNILKNRVYVAFEKLDYDKLKEKKEQGYLHNETKDIEVEYKWSYIEDEKEISELGNLQLYIQILDKKEMREAFQEQKELEKKGIYEELEDPGTYTYEFRFRLEGNILKLYNSEVLG